MLDAGNVPGELKTAKVTPVYKGGREADINYYRPISVLPILSKTFRRGYMLGLATFSKKSNTKPVSVHFKKNRSAEVALVHIKEKNSRKY